MRPLGSSSARAAVAAHQLRAARRFRLRQQRYPEVDGTAYASLGWFDRPLGWTDGSASPSRAVLAAEPWRTRLTRRPVLPDPVVRRHLGRVEVASFSRGADLPIRRQRRRPVLAGRGAARACACVNRLPAVNGDGQRRTTDCAQLPRVMLAPVAYGGDAARVAGATNRTGGFVDGFREPRSMRPKARIERGHF